LLEEEGKDRLMTNDYNAQQPGSPGPSPSAPMNMQALVGAILGAVGAVGGLFIPIAEMVLGVVAIVLSRSAAKDGKSPAVTAALILGIISIIVAIGSMILNYITYVTLGLL
jgi:hypothetical protein